MSNKPHVKIHKGGFTMGKNFGVITEQGFPAGQFGFDRLNEQENQKLNDEDQKKSPKKDDKFGR